MSGASRLIPLPSFLALALAAAHFWRAGWASLAAACVLAALLSWTRLAWVRQFLLLGLPLLAARWIWTTGQFVQIRQMLEQPWQRLAVILLSMDLPVHSGGQKTRRNAAQPFALPAQTQTTIWQTRQTRSNQGAYQHRHTAAYC